MRYQLKNVEALWPKLHAPFKFDNAEKRSVPCSAMDDGAAYELNFRISKDEAAEFGRAVNGVWKEWLKEQGKDAKTKPSQFPWKDDSENADYLIVKTKIKAAYGTSVTPPPRIYDNSAALITDPDFRLTTGSTINVEFTMVPYSTGIASGVSLRLNAVQVDELAPMAAGASPFQPLDSATQKAHNAMKNLEVYEQPTKAEPPAFADDDLDDLPF